MIYMDHAIKLSKKAAALRYRAFLGGRLVACLRAEDVAIYRRCNPGVVIVDMRALN